MNNALIVQLVIGGFGITGIVGAGVALFKLRPEVNAMAVTSMQGAAGEWKGLYEAKAAELADVEKDRDAWKVRALEAETALARHPERGGGRARPDAAS